MSRGAVSLSRLKDRLFAPDRVDRSEKGDTMIEILLALIVLGLTSVALIVAFSTTLSASATHRSLASADIAINNYSQQVIAGIEANQDLFTCPTPALTMSALNSELAISSPAPYNPTITSVQYWNSSNSTFSSTCIANAAEMVTVTLSSGQTMQFVVDSPTAGSNYVGGAPTGLTFLAPTSQITATSGADLPVNPVVEVNFGNSPDATDLSPINLSLGDQNGNATTAGTLSGCSSNDLNGVITYTGCTISLTTASAQAVDFTLVATDASSSGTLTATSAIIAVSGSTSSYLSFTTQPAAGYSGSLMTTQPVIKAYLGGTTTVDTTVMSITLTTSGSINGSYQLSSCSGTSGFSTTTESNGVVTVTDSSGHGGTFQVSGCDFSGQFYYDVNSGAVGTPYTMTASSLNVTSATSQPFAATGYGAAAQMEFIVEPTGGIATSTSANTVTMNAFEVQIEDAWGNLLSGQGQAGYAGSISVKVTSTGAALTTCTPTSSGGVFTFSGCGGPLGSNLTLTATATGTGSGGVTPEVSSAFTNSGPVASLVWYANYPQANDSPQPVAGASGSVMTNQPVLAWEDAGTNPGETGPEVVTADTTSVSFTSSYASGTESTVSPNGILTTCSNLPPINGIISAGNCTFVGLVGTNYTMKATTTSGPTITSANSSTFSPTGPGAATQLVFTPSPGVEPVAAAAGSPFTTEPVVVVEDAGGNIVSSASSQVEMNSYLYNSSSPTNPTVQGGSLLNCSTLAPVNGAVSLIPVSGYLDVEGSCAFGGTLGTSYQLVATSPGLTQAVSTTFTPTTFGPASAIVVTGCSSGVKWMNTCVLSATVQDAWSNTVTSFASGVTFADVGGAGTVSGLGTFTASGGIATDTVTGTSVGPELVSAAEGTITSPQYSFNVIGDTTTATLSESPTTVTYGNESASLFTITVVTGNHEQLPSTDPTLITVGSTSCTANVAPSGNGGSGSCSITNTALPYSATPYSVTATYGGDAQLQASSPSTGPGFTVTKDTSTVTVSENPTSVVYGNEASTTFTVNVNPNYGENLPGPGTENVTVNIGGGAASCVAAVATSTIGTCTIANTALPASGTIYAVTTTYPGDADISGSALATAATGLTVTKDTSTVAVSENPTSVAYGNEASTTFTVNVNPNYGENLPGPGTENVTVNIGGGAASCVAAVVTSTIGTCTIANTALPASGTVYAVTTTYPGDADISGSAPATASPGLTVTNATLTITASNTTNVYGTAPAAPTPIFSGFVNGETSSALTTQPTCSTTVTATTAVGSPTGTGTCSGAVDPNYTITYVAGNATISPATLTVTASAGTMTYGGTPPTVTDVITGYVNGQTSSVITTLPTCSTSATATTPAGTDAGADTCSGGVAANYTFNYVAANVTVNKATLTITASNTTNNYGTAPAAPTPGYSGFVNGQTSSALTTQPTCSTTVTATTAVGSPTGTGTCSGAVDPNYTITYVAGNATINKAPLTITASNTTNTYGTAPAAPAPIYSGFVNGQTSSVLTTQPTCSTTVTATTVVSTPTGTGTCSGAAAANYTITYVAGNATINKATLTITASNTTNTYGTAPAAPTAGFSGFVNGQTSSVLTTQPTCSTTVTATTPVGTPTGTGTCSGAAAANYSFTYVAGNATINKATLTITASSPTVPYGSSAPTISAGYSGFVNGQTSSALTTQPTCTTTYTTTSLPGTTPSTSCSGAVDANYTIGYVAGHVTITQATPTVVITNTGEPTGVSTGNIQLTATVTGVSGGVAPSGTLTWSVKNNGTAYGTCTTSTLSGSGPSTATCTLTNPGVGNYTATATYNGDTNYSALTTPSTFGEYIGSTSASVPTGPEYYTIDATTGGSGSGAVNTITPGAETLTSITMIFSGATSSSVNQTVAVGKYISPNYTLTSEACTVTANTTESCALTVSVPITSGTPISIAGYGNGQHTDFWIVTYTNP
jgi:hypothetical protein